jgi:DNA mismatch repair protein MSH3
MSFASSSDNSQPTISVFFKASTRKRDRDSSYIDLTQDDGPDSTTQKRIRLSTTNIETNRESSSRSNLADSWRFSPEKAKQATTSATSIAENQRHEAFKRKLLQDNSLFLRRKSEDNEEDQANEPSVNDALSEDDERFEKLHEMFAHKSSVQVKGKAKQAPLTKTKATAIGPSGEPYTPLEKQVC